MLVEGRVVTLTEGETHTHTHHIAFFSQPAHQPSCLPLARPWRLRRSRFEPPVLDIQAAVLRSRAVACALDALRPLQEITNPAAAGHVRRFFVGHLPKFQSTSDADLWLPLLGRPGSREHSRKCHTGVRLLSSPVPARPRGKTDNWQASRPFAGTSPTDPPVASVSAPPWLLLRCRWRLRCRVPRPSAITSGPCPKTLEFHGFAPNPPKAPFRHADAGVLCIGECNSTWNEAAVVRRLLHVQKRIGK